MRASATPGAVRVAAVDLGATSGRVMAGLVGSDRLDLTQEHRFPNGPVRLHRTTGPTLYWDILGIYRETLAGLRKADAAAPVAGIGIDAWAVDHGLLAADGTLLGNPTHYRDAGTDGVAERLATTIPHAELYRTTAVRSLPFNTLYQLVAARGTPALEQAHTMLLIPDLLTYWLTGRIGAEATNASTTGLYDARTRNWARDLARRAGVPARVLPPLHSPGAVRGPVLDDVAAELGLASRPPVIAVGSHDTASAVAAVPMRDREDAAYISSGTWSLVGVELEHPVTSDDARRAEFTNETGVDGTYRFLRNVMGLWVLSESLRTWQARGAPADLERLLDAAAEVPPFRSVVDIDDPVFLPPGDMPARLRAVCHATGQPAPEGEPEVVRTILESLALAYRRTLRHAGRLSGRRPARVHVVGGGVRNELLCQLTADACGLPVLAGPVEAAALGNVLVQGRTLGVPLDDLSAMRALVRRTHPPRRYDPRAGATAWDRVEHRLETLRS